MNRPHKKQAKVKIKKKKTPKVKPMKMGGYTVGGSFVYTKNNLEIVLPVGFDDTSTWWSYTSEMLPPAKEIDDLVEQASEQIDKQLNDPIVEEKEESKVETRPVDRFTDFLNEES